MCFFFQGIANFKLTCEAKSGKAGSQLISDEATLQCKSSSEAENKVLISVCKHCNEMILPCKGQIKQKADWRDADSPKKRTN